MPFGMQAPIFIMENLANWCINRDGVFFTVSSQVIGSPADSGDSETYHELSSVLSLHVFSSLASVSPDWICFFVLTGQ